MTSEGESRGPPPDPMGSSPLCPTPAGIWPVRVWRRFRRRGEAEASVAVAGESGGEAMGMGEQARSSAAGTDCPSNGHCSPLSDVEEGGIGTGETEGAARVARCSCRRWRKVWSLVSTSGRMASMAVAIHSGSPFSIQREGDRGGDALPTWAACGPSSVEEEEDAEEGGRKDTMGGGHTGPADSDEETEGGDASGMAMEGSKTDGGEKRGDEVGLASGREGKGGGTLSISGEQTRGARGEVAASHVLGDAGEEGKGNNGDTAMDTHVMGGGAAWVCGSTFGVVMGVVVGGVSSASHWLPSVLVATLWEITGETTRLLLSSSASMTEAEGEGRSGATRGGGLSCGSTRGEVDRSWGGEREAFLPTAMDTPTAFSVSTPLSRRRIEMGREAFAMVLGSSKEEESP